MSQLLQVQFNQRLKPNSSPSTESMTNSPCPSSPGGMLGSPPPGGTLSPLGGPSSPQGMPIPLRRQPINMNMIINESMNQLPPHWHLTSAQGSGQGFVGTSGLTTMSGNNGLTMPLVGFNLSTGGQTMWNVVEPGIEAMDLGGGMDTFDNSSGGPFSKLSMAVDDDDIFKVERNDLLGPTLAELNAPDADTLLDGLNFDDLYWPQDPLGGALDPSPSPQTPGGPGGGGALDQEDSVGGFVCLQTGPSSSFPLIGHLHHGHTSLPGSSVPVQSSHLAPIFLSVGSGENASGGFNVVQPSSIHPLQASSSTGGGGGLRELLLRRELQNSMDSQGSPQGSSSQTQDPSPLGTSLPRSMLSPSPGSLSPRLSSSAPTGQQSWAESWQQRREAVWSRRDPRPHLLSTGSLAEGAGGGSTSSLISADVLSPGREFSLSMDEGFDSDELSDRDSSDEETEGSDAESNAGSTGGPGGSHSRRERYFWQYNVQAKGPKGQRLVLAPTQEDPHVLQRPTDPVFSPLCHIQGIKHSGKARKGDGNDLTPNPKKLFTIGKELDRLNKTIAEMTPVADVPNAIKSRSRKEKNKLASRACRLKKKAQHEANKLKLYGLEQEHKRLISCIEQARIAVFQRMDSSVNDLNPESVSAKIDRISKLATRQKIGGHTTEFVNRVLDKVKQGVPDGGIGDL